ncbi:MAG: TolC family protein [Nannocystaceae bacterium]|nr:TolC family protein [Myxococcales bacterium]
MPSISTTLALLCAFAFAPGTPEVDRSGAPQVDTNRGASTPSTTRPTTSPTTTSPSTTRPSSVTPSPSASPGARPPTRPRPRPLTGQGDPSLSGEALTPTDTGELPSFEIDHSAPFPTESLELSQVLKQSLETNIDLRTNAYDVEISEANIMAALGAYDVFLTAGLSASLAKTPQRGSAFTISTGQRSVSGNVGFNRKLETGGDITLSINVQRDLANQPINFLNPNAGSAELTRLYIQPTLTFNHPLLKGAGIKVNRADIDKAKIAKTQAEAAQLGTAQNVVRDILNAYWEVLYAHRDLVNKRRAIALTKEQLERTRAEVAAGRRSPIELRSIEQTMAQRENELLLAENALVDRSLTLRTVMGQDLAALDIIGVEPTTDPASINPRQVDIKAEIERAMQVNPDVRQLQLAIASRRIDELVAANQRLPQLDFRGTFAPQGRSIDRFPNAASGDAGENATWGLAFRNFFNSDLSNGLLADYQISGSLSLTWDIQNRGPKGNHQRAQLELRKAQESLRSTRQQISGAVIRSANNLRNSAKRMEVTEQAVSLAEENLEAEKARYSVGRSTAYDVLFRMDELEIAEANALRSQIDYLIAITELQVLTGELLPAYGLELHANAPR